MARYQDESELEDDERDWEDPDESDMDENDDPELVECPYCRKPIAEEAEHCHHCGQYLARERAPRRLPIWITIGAVLMALAMVAWAIVGR